LFSVEIIPLSGFFQVISGHSNDFHARLPRNWQASTETTSGEIQKIERNLQ